MKWNNKATAIIDEVQKEIVVSLGDKLQNIGIIEAQKQQNV